MIFGQPWHGPIANGVLTLPNGEARTVPASAILPAGSEWLDTWYVNFGAQAVGTSSEEAALGISWKNDAVLFGPNKALSPVAAAGLGSNSWLYCAPSGAVWQIALEDFTLPALTVTNASRPTATFPLVLKARRFGLFGAGVQAWQQILSSVQSYVALAGASLAGTITAAATTFSARTNHATGDGRNGLAHSPTGAFATVEIAFNWIGTGVGYLPYVVKVLGITLSEPSPGAAPTAALSVWRPESYCLGTTLTWTVNASDVSAYRGLAGCLFGTSETPVDVLTVEQGVDVTGGYYQEQYAWASNNVIYRQYRFPPYGSSNVLGRYQAPATGASHDVPSPTSGTPIQAYWNPRNNTLNLAPSSHDAVC